MTTLTFTVTRDSALDSGRLVWTAIPDGSPIGGVTAPTLAELHEEVEAIKHFVLDAPTDQEVAVKYVYSLDDEATHVLNAFLEAAEARKEYPARSTKVVATLHNLGLPDEDVAVLIGLSAKRVQQLRTAS